MTSACFPYYSRDSVQRDITICGTHDMAREMYATFIDEVCRYPVRIAQLISVIRISQISSNRIDNTTGKNKDH